MKPQVRAFYSMDHRGLQNLGDALVPPLLSSLGYSYGGRDAIDDSVANPGRCLIAIGSLLTDKKLLEVPHPLDVWGCGWKGTRPSIARTAGARFFAVRGPLTAAGMGLSPDIALGDPALLVRYTIAPRFTKHQHSVVIPHIDRVDFLNSKERLARTGCEKLVSTYVWMPEFRRITEGATLHDAAIAIKLKLKSGINLNPLWPTLAQIAGASFVLTASLHGAIIAQSYGVPWAAYDDGHVDAPAKWADWAAYLGIDIEFVPNLPAGRRWWDRFGCHGRIRTLLPLINSFPYPIEDTIRKRIIRGLP